MIREEVMLQSYIDWLKSKGCVFYAPFDQENGLRDIIGGTTGSAYSNTNSQNLQWNSSVGAYRFYSTRAPQNCCRFPLSGFGDRMGTGNSYTWMCDIRKISSSIFVFIIGYISTQSNYATGIDLVNVYDFKESISNSSFSHICLVDDYESKRVKLYIDGVMVYNYDYSSDTTTLNYPARRPNWKNAYYNYITVGGSFGTHVCDSYFKNAMFFNRALSQAEITEIQGL